MSKKPVVTIKQYDYSSKEACLKDVPKMEKTGYRFVKEGDTTWYGANFAPYETDDGNGGKLYCGTFIKSKLW
jgi:hypothetical protein